MDSDCCWIKLIDQKPRQRNRRQQLWKALAKLDLTIFRMNETRGGFRIATSSRMTEKLLLQRNKNTLNTYGFTPLTPLDYDTRRTLLAKYVDVQIANASKEQITKSIEDSNIGVKVDDIIHIPGSPKLLKIKFETIEMAKDAKEYGIVILNQQIQPMYLEQEIYIKLEPCFTCFRYTHTTSQCPTPQLVVCSECGEKEHLFSECPNNFKRCLNCTQGHRTLAASCPVRKKIIKEKTKEKINNNRQGRRPEEQEGKPVYSNEEPSPLPTNVLAVIYTAIIYATCEEMTTPGSYQSKMDEIYEMNGLPMVKVPAPSNPKTLLQAIRAAHLGEGTTSPQPSQPRDENLTGNNMEELRAISENNSPLINQLELTNLTQSTPDLYETTEHSCQPTRRKRQRKGRKNKKGKTQVTSTPTDSHKEATETETNSESEEESINKEDPVQLQLRNSKCYWTKLPVVPQGLLPLQAPRSECHTPEHWGMKAIGKEIYKPQEGVTQDNQETLWNFGAIAMFLDPAISEETFRDMAVHLFTRRVVFDNITWLDSRVYDTIFKQQYTPHDKAND